MYDEIYLRALTGRLVGRAVAEMGVNKLAVIAPKNMICTAMATAIEVSFLNHGGGRTGHFEKAPEDYEMVAFVFGGESSEEEMKKGFMEVLRDMADREIESDILIHVRTYNMGVLEEALKDEKLKEYLEERGVFVYTFDLERGFFKMNEVIFSEEDHTLFPILEYPVSVEHAQLLNKSLRGLTLRWVKD